MAKKNIPGIAAKQASKKNNYAIIKERETDKTTINAKFIENIANNNYKKYIVNPDASNNIIVSVTDGKGNNVEYDKNTSTINSSELLKIDSADVMINTRRVEIEIQKSITYASDISDYIDEDKCYNQFIKFIEATTTPTYFGDKYVITSSTNINNLTADISVQFAQTVGNTHNNDSITLKLHDEGGKHTFEHYCYDWNDVNETVTKPKTVLSVGSFLLSAKFMTSVDLDSFTMTDDEGKKIQYPNNIEDNKISVTIDGTKQDVSNETVFSGPISKNVSIEYTNGNIGKYKVDNISSFIFSTCSNNAIQYEEIGTLTANYELDCGYVKVIPVYVAGGKQEFLSTDTTIIDQSDLDNNVKIWSSTGINKAVEQYTLQTWMNDNGGKVKIYDDDDEFQLNENKAIEAKSKNYTFLATKDIKQPTSVGTAYKVTSVDLSIDLSAINYTGSSKYISKNQKYNDSDFTTKIVIDKLGTTTKGDTKATGYAKICKVKITSEYNNTYSGSEDEAPICKEIKVGEKTIDVKKTTTTGQIKYETELIEIDLDSTDYTNKFGDSKDVAAEAQWSTDNTVTINYVYNTVEE